MPFVCPLFFLRPRTQMDEQQQLKKPNRAFIPVVPSGNLGFCKLNHILLVFHSINNQANQEEEEEENKTPMNNIIFHFKVTLILSISFCLFKIIVIFKPFPEAQQ